MAKNKVNDNRADTRQYEHEIPGNFVFRMYRKYALAAAIEVVVPSNTKRPSDSSIPNGNFFAANCKLIAPTNPYAAIPITGSGTPCNYKRMVIDSL